MADNIFLVDTTYSPSSLSIDIFHVLLVVLGLESSVALTIVGGGGDADEEDGSGISSRNLTRGSF
jgi:hypothetical protein